MFLNNMFDYVIQVCQANVNNQSVLKRSLLNMDVGFVQEI